MNADAMDKDVGQNDTELRAALVEQCRLPPSALERIAEYMRSGNIGFVDAALALGLITQDDIDASQAWLRRSHPDEKAGLVESAIRKLSEQKQSQNQFVVRVDGTVRPGPRLILASDSYNSRDEAIRTLRTELLLRNETGRANVVCLVSPSSGEGRSQLAAELAIAFAQLGRRTILVDADLRRPQQHLLFPAGNERGLGDSLMRGERPYQYRVEGFPQMSLLTSGVVPTNPLELLSSGRFERLLTDWRNNNEFVVIDTPPAVQYADALAVATLTGRVLLVSRAEKTSYKDTREMLRKLATTRAQILGGVINYF